MGFGPGEARNRDDPRGRRRFRQSTIRAAGSAKPAGLGGTFRAVLGGMFSDGFAELTAAEVAATLLRGRRRPIGAEEDSGS
jgi:hypothetical protein